MPVRVTRGELDRWRAAAAAQGLTLSAWVRKTLDATASLVETTASLQALYEGRVVPAAPAKPRLSYAEALRSWPLLDEPAQRDTLPAPPGDEAPICSRCNDTHRMPASDPGPFGDGTWMCTGCPVPCQRCRGGGNGPYCANTPCSCECHVGSYATSAATRTEAAERGAK
jgi:hypothetical protein